MLSRITIYLFIALMLHLPANAQRLRISLDWASFEYDQQNAYVEFYYGFPASELNYVEQEGRQQGLTLGAIRLFADGQTAHEYAWKSENSIPAEGAERRDIIDKVSLLVPYGDYDAEIVLKDLNRPSNFDSVRFSLSLPQPAFGRARLSEIQLAGAVSQSDHAHSPFYKNGLIVEPNPSLIYHYEKPALFFYLEAYDLPSLGLSDGYRLAFLVQKDGDTQPEGLPAKAMIKKTVVHPSVEFGMLNVGNLETGNYRLIVELHKADGAPIATREKAFYVIQKTAAPVADGSTPFDDSIFSVMDSAGVELEFQMVFYMLSKDEQQVHKQIANLDGKRRFVYNLWRNKFPSEPINENQVRAEYYRRFQHANDQFRAFTIDGWKTDRGRVYMIYGPPDDIERRPNEQNFSPYEIWFYQKLQNGARFVFGDLEGYKNYRLVHSDLFGEIQDRNFMSVLRKGY